MTNSPGLPDRAPNKAPDKAADRGPARTDDQLGAAVRAQAFRLLLDGGQPVPVARLGVPQERTATDVRRAVDEQVLGGRITVAGDDLVTGSLGLSVTPTRHRLSLPEGTRHTWCALDALGVFGALRAGGQIRSSAPDGDEITIELRDGVAHNAGRVTLLIPRRTAGPTVTTWCPLVNFFTDQDRARAWADGNGVGGQLCTLDEASELATRQWTEAIGQADSLGSWSYPT